MRNLLTAWVALIGFGLITAGAAQFSHALGLVVGGATLIGIAVTERNA